MPRSVEEAQAILAAASRDGMAVALRGAGRSYGDAATLEGGLVLDLGGWNRILDFDGDQGVATLEPGVTIEALWRHALPRGYWPAVVPGTMHPTVGGCAAMNIHGKNNFAVGTFGDQVLDFELLLADGSLVRASRDEEPRLFHSAIGGFGMLGIFTRLRLRLKHVHSGDLLVTPMATGSVAEMVALLEARRTGTDYLVGWVDVLGGGRGLVHEARYLRPGEDADPQGTLAATHQEPSRFLAGILPKSWVWPGLWLLLNRPGMRMVNAAKYRMGRRHARNGPYRQSLASFSFLLDYIPRWERAYAPGGLVQYQSFIPKEHAASVFEQQVVLARKAGVSPYLGVMKRHREDPFLMTHAVDGYSLALDFPFHPGRRERLMGLVRRLDALVVEARGRFYFAKDSLLEPGTWRRTCPDPALAAFTEEKLLRDPQNRFQTDISRRVLAPLAAAFDGAPRRFSPAP